MLKDILEIIVGVKEEWRKEVDYTAQTIGDGIRKGFEEGFERVKNRFFKLMIATFCTIFGILLISYGTATFIDIQFKIPGFGFIVLGILALIIGLFASIKD